MTIPAHTKARIRDAVLSAAKAEFEVSGYDRASIRAIASRAGVSPRAVFAYFVCKIDLYRTLYGEQPVTAEEGGVLRSEVEAVRGALNTAHHLKMN